MLFRCNCLYFGRHSSWIKRRHDRIPRAADCRRHLGLLQGNAHARTGRRTHVWPASGTCSGPGHSDWALAQMEASVFATTSRKDCHPYLHTRPAHPAVTLTQCLEPRLLAGTGGNDERRGGVRCGTRRRSTLKARGRAPGAAAPAVRAQPRARALPLPAPPASLRPPPHPAAASSSSVCADHPSERLWVGLPGAGLGIHLGAAGRGSRQAPASPKAPSRASVCRGGRAPEPRALHRPRAAHAQPLGSQCSRLAPRLLQRDTAQRQAVEHRFGPNQTNKQTVRRDMEMGLAAKLWSRKG